MSGLNFMAIHQIVDEIFQLGQSGEPTDQQANTAIPKKHRKSIANIVLILNVSFVKKINKNLKRGPGVQTLQRPK